MLADFLDGFVDEDDENDPFSVLVDDDLTRPTSVDIAAGTGVSGVDFVVTIVLVIVSMNEDVVVIGRIDDCDILISDASKTPTAASGTVGKISG